MTYIFNSSFLRGLGMGLIISGLVLSISKTSFFDRETAPVQPTSTSSVNQANQTAQSDPRKDVRENNSNTKTANTTANNAINTPKSTAASTIVNGKPAGASIKPPAPNPANFPATGKPVTNYVIFVVPKGSNSGKITQLLFNAGLIKDKAKFETVVNKMNLARRFKAGTFTIPKGASEVDIVLALTK